MATGPEQRVLTDGEKRLACSVYGVAIKYDAVSIFRKKYIFFQPDNRAMAPDGNIYFAPSDPTYEADFSTADKWKQHTFIHELAHVWQHQTGVNVVMRGIVEREYTYKLDQHAKLSEFKIEQQGQIVADYFLLKKHNTRTTTSNYRPLPSVSDYEKILPFTPV